MICKDSLSIKHPVAPTKLKWVVKSSNKRYVPIFHLVGGRKRRKREEKEEEGKGEDGTV